MTRLAISPCPNDTFAFYGLIHGKTDFDPKELNVKYADIEDLNRLCSHGEPDFCKISFGAYLQVRDDYQLLNAGSALGFGCGPLIVTRGITDIQDLKGKQIAVPGKHTTAALLLQLMLGPEVRMVEMVFDQIMPMVARGDVEAGLIIHESRFTYRRYGLNCLVDLGEWWETTSGLPIPLGGIVARKTLGPDRIQVFDAALSQSVSYAWANKDETVPFMQTHAQEMEPEIMSRHVDLYVNDFTLSLGQKGKQAVDYLVNEAQQKGLL